MKKIALVFAVAIITAIGCKKSINNNVTPNGVPQTGDSSAQTKANVVTIVAINHTNVPTSDRYLDVKINYLSGNDSNYVSDNFIVYSGSKFLFLNTFNVGLFKSHEFNTPSFTYSTGYKILLVRNYS